MPTCHICGEATKGGDFVWSQVAGERRAVHLLCHPTAAPRASEEMTLYERQTRALESVAESLLKIANPAFAVTQDEHGNAKVTQVPSAFPARAVKPTAAQEGGSLQHSGPGAAARDAGAPERPAR